jgi:hypothetical protein
MTRDRVGDINRKHQVVFIYDAWIQPDGIIKTKYPGKLTSPRWNYRDNPINGIGEKEYAAHFRCWENKPPKEVIDEV